MTRFGRLREVLAFGLLGLGVCVGQSAKEARDKAKEMHDIAGTLADQCAGLKMMCRAAAMDKKYQKECDEFKVSLNQSSNRDLATGYEKMDQKLYPTASLYAGRVCDYDPDFAAKKRELLAAIEKKSDDSPAKIADAERLFNSGELDAASAAAHPLADSTYQARANAILQKVSSYNAFLQEAKRREGSDPSGAKESYQAALNISRNGPGDPGGNINRLNAILLAKAKEEEKPKQPTVIVDQPRVPVMIANQPKVPVLGKAPNQPPPPPPPDINAQVAQLFAKEKLDEPLRVREALRDCQQVQRLQPGNTEAQACVARIEGVINSDPKEQAKVLADGIRAFYASRYSEAEDDFTSYLSSTTAKYRGAAHFYLGASRLYRGILDGAGQKVQDAMNNADVQRSFKEAHSDCYRPVGKYVSPVVLAAWNASSSGGAACAR